ncbi:MAG: Fe-S cluster assembly protein HesB [Candidatus Viridilinea halotolerans]|uniref:Fe-S cluster assembly protein HesB n=1 Tax=Candidatus Viridilinea halotolerans TaxID=2491704 RepID=A0A426U9M8_9CHLR|nr:MAG: Fe-S cluster assembly protein HesB [Candidatus Viridilinea halotolerans]
MLLKIYQQLHAHFGPMMGAAAYRPWWPIFGPDAPFEILVGAVLVQQTRWEAVEQTVLRLLEVGLLQPAALAAVDTEQLGQLIRPVAFYRQKAPGLSAIAAHITQRYQGNTAVMLAQPLAPLRQELLALPRIGYETCDTTLLYGGQHAIFVIDEYTRRLFERVFQEQGTENEEQRVGSKGIWRQPYEKVRLRVETALRVEQKNREQRTEEQALFADFHAQINEVCVRYCLSRPRCDGPPARRVYSRQAGRDHYHGRVDGCPLRDGCGYYKRGGSEGRSPSEKPNF